MGENTDNSQPSNGPDYDPSPFNVNQYRDEYGPGGVPQDYTFHAKSPLQNPNGIRVLSVVLFVIACVPLYPAILSGFAMPGIIYAGLIFLGAAAAGVWGFIIAGRRQRWLEAKGIPRKDW